jgi:hypothetical protein
MSLAPSVAEAAPHTQAVQGSLEDATARLYRSVCESDPHRAFIDTIHSLMRESTSSPPPADAKLVIVPAAFYRENPRSGADGHVVRAQAERLGWALESIPLASDGSTVENARTICSWLTAQSGARLVLVSLSKGGSDLKLALAQPDAARAFERVACWINLCGILDGTPLSEWLLSWQVEAALSRLYYRMLGVSVDFMRDLRRSPAGPLDFELQLPAHLQLISIVGFPLRKHMTSGLGRRCYDRVAPHGPNDGVIVLSDVCAQPGLIYPIWGADHLLRSGADIDQLLSAVLRFVGQQLSR